MSPLFSPLWSDSGRISLITAASGDGEGVKIGWVILILKAGSSVPCGGSDLVASAVLGLEFGPVVRFDNGMG